MLVAVINSHHGKIPCGKWLRATFEAVRFCARKNWRVAASVGMHQWEFLLYAAATCGCPIKVWIPADFDDSLRVQLIADFNLNVDVRFEHIPGHWGRKDWWQARDRAIISAADVIIPVSVRPGGNMEALLAEFPDKIYVDRFRVEFEKSRWKIPPPPAPEELNPALKSRKWHYLTHWTHTFYSNWCTESKYQFYESLLHQEDEYSHSAFRTLMNMLETGRICATPRKIYAGERVLSFTALTPAESLKFMRWRSGLVRRYWEPYGIALDRQTLVELGAQPVRYVEANEIRAIEGKVRKFYHLIKSRRYRWVEESEWRLFEDLKLDLVPSERLLVITRIPAEAQHIMRRFGVRAVGMIEN